MAIGTTSRRSSSTTPSSPSFSGENMTSPPRFFPPFASRPRPPDGQLLAPTVVGPESARLRAVLAATSPADLTQEAVRSDVADNLWMLSPEGFCYFLPALMHLAVEHYDALGLFASALLSALTEPSRDDVVQALDRAEQVPVWASFPPETMRLLRQQQLEWYDSGWPVATYRARVDGLSAAECAAVLDFLVAIRDAHGADFPFGEPQVAIDRLEARRRVR
jgi:hypothetical protein